MKNNLLLSICIPTRDRAGFLKKNLEMISKIIDSKTMEIIIGDDGSTDNTEEVVKQFVKKHSILKVKYKLYKKPIYFDRNVLDIVKRASGKFCWLLGDDDVPSPGSIKKITSVITKYSDLSLIHLNYKRYDNLLKKITANKMINGIDKDMLFKNYEDFYFKDIKNSYFRFLGTHTITMSSDVINRARWMNAAKNLKKYTGHNFIHSFVIGTIIRPKNSVYLVAKPQVTYLSNNHRVWPNDIWKDYNSVLLNYLVAIGYPKDKIKKMKDQQSEYEKREAISKNKLLSGMYFMALKLYNRIFK